MAVAVPPTDVSEDRVPEALAGGTPPALAARLRALVGVEQVLTRAIDLVRYASDASCYRLIPQAVVVARHAQDVAAVFAYGRANGIPVTLRSGGTSLNGQGQGDGILIDVRRHFAGVRVLEDGAAIRVKPGTTLGVANRVLHKHQRRIGPDPASTDIATVGGVIANNSGGMRCGVVADAYSTLRSLTFVLPSGTTIDTAEPGAAERFAREEPELHDGLAKLRDELRADSALSDRIRRKFAIKNTTGYRLCAFLDADEPLEIFRRLIVGSEGTLAFIAEAVFDTVPHGHHTATGLVFFGSVDDAADAVPGLVAAGATAVELMVHPSLIAASWTLPGVPEAWRELPPEGAALLVEMRTDDPQALDALEASALEALADAPAIQPPELTRDHEATEVFWRVREGMQGIVGLVRPPGSAFLIEDVCVPPERIAEATREIQALLGEHQFLTGVAGHASAGNLHFLLTPNLAEAADRDRYESFMTKLVTLIVDKYDGSLKAEHGTGRNMAPYVAHEWGDVATELMWRVRTLADPGGLLSPDVMLSRDPDVHLSHLKSFPAIEEAGKAHLCIECGFCEPVCPSRHLTTTPRQRIAVRREIARQPEGSAVREALLRDYAYDAVETCAADGSCALVCPLGIDTGKLIKDVRAREHSPRAEQAALKAAEHWDLVERAGRAGLRAGGTLARAGLAARASSAARRVLGDELVPAWSSALPGPASPKLPETARAGAAAVYLPACINRIFGRSRGAGADEPSVIEAIVALSSRAGSPVWIPSDVAGTCCGTPFSSKGYTSAHASMAARLVADLWRWSDEGALPVVIDATSCTHGITAEVPEALGDEDRERLAKIEIVDAVRWAERLLPSLEVRAPLESATVHPTCSSRHLGLAAPLVALTRALAAEVDVPLDATCCGMAGDRGLLHPELTAAATAGEAREVAERTYETYLSANRTCEIALEAATGRPYASVLVALERATR